jgi:hypothetical protein
MDPAHSPIVAYRRFGYGHPLSTFLAASTESIIGALTQRSAFNVDQSQVWDGDLRYRSQGWSHHSFVGDRWNQIHKPERRSYLLNAYRVLLTRARQGTVIVVPPGDAEDPTRAPAFYDPVFRFLRDIGVPELGDASN